MIGRGPELLGDGRRCGPLGCGYAATKKTVAVGKAGARSWLRTIARVAIPLPGQRFGLAWAEWCGVKISKRQSQDGTQGGRSRWPFTRAMLAHPAEVNVQSLHVCVQREREREREGPTRQTAP